MKQTSFSEGMPKKVLSLKVSVELIIGFSVSLWLIHAKVPSLLIFVPFSSSSVALMKSDPMQEKP